MRASIASVHFAGGCRNGDVDDEYQRRSIRARSYRPSSRRATSGESPDRRSRPPRAEKPADDTARHSVSAAHSSSHQLYCIIRCYSDVVNPDGGYEDEGGMKHLEQLSLSETSHGWCRWQRRREEVNVCQQPHPEVHGRPRTEVNTSVLPRVFQVDFRFKPVHRCR